MQNKPRYIIYPHKLLELDVKEIRNIINNSFIFTANVLERELPKLIKEIEDEAKKQVSQTTIDAAIYETEEFMDNIMNTFNSKFDADNFEKRRHNMKRGYMSVFNQPSTLIFAHFQDGQTGIISKPLFHALADTCSFIFDYYISKSPEMDYMLSKSNNQDRKTIKGINNKFQARYYFVKVLKEYGANEQQIIRNFDTVFGKNKKNALASLTKLPKIFRT